MKRAKVQHRKLRRDAVLRKLPAELQQEVMDYLEGEGRWKEAHTLREGARWLKRSGVSVSICTLSRYCEWRRLQEDLRRSEETAVAFVKECRKRGWIRNAEEEFLAGQIFFGRLAMMQKDNPGFVRLLRERTREKGVKVQERKVALLEAREAKIMAAVTNEALTAEEKEAAVKQILGIKREGGAESGDQARKVYDPGSVLLPYQRRWVEDESRWKFGLMSRQVGKDFSSGYEGIQEILRGERAGEAVTWLIAAPSERQSLESLAKWKDWAQAFKVSLAGYEEKREGKGESLLKSATISFPHGSRVIAVPGKPDTVRGYSANVLLTEFAFFEQPDLTWRAILPSITNPLRGGEKKVRLITTPNGIGNKAHEIWVRNYGGGTEGTEGTRGTEGTKETKGTTRTDTDGHGPTRTEGMRGGKNQWSCHFVDIYTAVREGLPVDVEQLKAAIDDPEGWAQEFECQFLDAQVTLLPYELIASCESAEASESCAPEFWQAAAPGPLYMGIDYGRRRDLTVAWTVMRQGKALRTVEVLALDNVPGPDQEEILSARIRRCARVCVDATGPGQNFGEHLAREFGQYDPERHLFGKIELCAFTNTLKQEIYPNLRLAFEKKLVLVPASRAVREDLHSVNRVTTPGGQISYRAPHTADGHADRCAALALAARAGGGAEAEEGGFHIIDSRINRVLAGRRERSLA